MTKQETMDDAIAALERRVAPMDKVTLAIRGHMGGFEPCDWQLEDVVAKFIKAIGSGDLADLPQGFGCRDYGNSRYELCCIMADALEDWCNGNPCTPKTHPPRLGVNPARLVKHLGDRTPLKAFQAYMTRMKLHIPYSWPGIDMFPRCKWRTVTQTTMVHDTRDGKPDTISLDAMIDHLEPCNWHFEKNVEMLCKAIGGNLRPGGYYAACGRNVNQRPERKRMRVVARALEHFSGINGARASVDQSIIKQLGKKTPQKCWLAASFAKALNQNLAL